MANFCKALLCTVCFVILAGNAHAQVPPTSPDGSQPEWKEYFGKIENIDTGKYDIIFREVGTNCVSNTEPVEISLREIPAAPVVSNITYPTCAEATGSVVLSGLPKGNWIINPVNISGSGQTATITGLTAGQSYAFTVTSDKCTSEPSVLVSFDPAPLTPDPPTAEAQTLCAGSHVSDLEPHYTSENQIRWYSQTGGSTPLATDTELESGTYYATVLSDGCESARTAVQINIIPQVTPEVTINSNNAEICQGEEASFFAMVREGATGESYQWFLNNEPTDIKSSTFTSSTLNNGNTLSCLVSVTGTCVLETQVMSEVLTVSFNPKITVEAKDITKCGDLIGSFTALGLDPNKQYEYQLIPKSQPGKPVITLVGDNPLTWTLGQTFVDPGATAYDEKDGDITSDIVAVSNVNVNTEGTYQITYNVTDSDGNAAEEVVRSVVVEEGIDWTYEGTMTFVYAEESYVYERYLDFQEWGLAVPELSFPFENIMFQLIFKKNKIRINARYKDGGEFSYDMFTDQEIIVKVNEIIYIIPYDENLGAYTLAVDDYIVDDINNFSVKLKYTLAPPVFEEVTIGTQTWMAKNLDIDDGEEGIYVYGGNENNPDYDYNLATYGRLYTWEAAVRVAKTVEGWHLPSDTEWSTLSNYLGGTSVAGGKLKEAGNTHWRTPNVGATNNYNFTALPAGHFDNLQGFSNVTTFCAWWSSTDYDGYPYDGYLNNAYSRSLFYEYSDLRVTSGTKDNGCSVRLIKDYSHTPTIDIIGEPDININVGDSYTDAGATATDARYGNITSRIVTVNNVNTAVAGTYTITYNITTEDGYSAVEVVRTVVVEQPTPQFEEVTIGTQTWMVKNLDIDDGEDGIYVYGGNENNPDYEYNLATYGRLYTWDAAMRVAATVEGWHLPNNTEWSTLMYYLGGTDVTGGKMKETGTTHWNSPNTGATNSSGLTVLGAGAYYSSAFRELKSNSRIWSSTQKDANNANYASLSYNSAHLPIVFNYYFPKINYISVRLIKDYSHSPTITLLGGANIIVYQESTYIDPGFTAYDVRYGNITSSVIVTGSVDTSTIGIYTITYNVTTEDGNSAEEVVRTVVVE